VSTSSRFYNPIALKARISIWLRLLFAGYNSYRQVYHPYVDLAIRLTVCHFFRNDFVDTPAGDPGVGPRGFDRVTDNL
jgi:hypothetical protein